MNHRQRYFNKIMKEFNEKGWSTDKVIGRANPFNIVKNKSMYDKFVQRVKQERSYNKEREKITAVMKPIYEQRKAARKERTLDLKSKLRGQGYSERDIRKIMLLKKEEGLSAGKVLNKYYLNRAIAKQTFDSLTNEFVYTTKDGVTKTRKGALIRFFKDPQIKAELNKFTIEMRNDPNALHNSEVVLQYFLDTIIPNRYEEWRRRAGRFVSPPGSFYVELVQELNKYYRRLKDRNN